MTGARGPVPWQGWSGEMVNREDIGFVVVLGGFLEAAEAKIRYTGSKAS